MCRYSHFVRRLYMGVGFFMTSWANLTGTPIAGRLLGTQNFTWYKPIVFSGVTMTVGGALMLVSRMMWSTSRDSQIV